MAGSMSGQVGGTSAPPRRSQSGSNEFLTSGWLACAAILLMVAGAFNILHGLVALNESSYLVNEVLFANMDAWGWTFLIWGAVQVLAGAFATTGSVVARGTGIGMAMFACMLWFLMIFAAPFAAIIGIAVNVMIVYGLTAPDTRARA